MNTITDHQHSAPSHQQQQETHKTTIDTIDHDHDQNYINVGKHLLKRIL
jgi:hypothetical protein